jgi:hypothetical protein
MFFSSFPIDKLKCNIEEAGFQRIAGVSPVERFQAEGEEK